MRPENGSPDIPRNSRVCPGAINPRAWSSAMRAVTPEPVGLRSIWRSAKTQRFQLSRVDRRAVGDDRAVEKAEVGFPGMVDGHARPDGIGQRTGCRLQVRYGAFEEIEPEPIGGQDRVERAAIGDVGHDPADARHVNREVERVHERRHALERHRRHRPVLDGAGQGAAARMAPRS